MKIRLSLSTASWVDWSLGGALAAALVLDAVGYTVLALNKDCHTDGCLALALPALAAIALHLVSGVMGFVVLIWRFVNGQRMEYRQLVFLALLWVTFFVVQFVHIG